MILFVKGVGDEMLINFDLKQIEIVILAQLSEDQTLIEMVNQGRDLYKYFAAVMYDKLEYQITKEERYSLKAPVLSISYGKGAKHMAEDSGKSIEWCQSFIDLFYQTFPKVRELHQRWINEVHKTGYIMLPWGINLRFNKYLWDKESQEKILSPKGRYWEPEIKNYPVQHTAFLFISTYIAVFWRQKALLKRDIECTDCETLGISGIFECTRCHGNKYYTKYLLVSTVHDSLTLDCRPEYVNEAISDLNEVLDNLPQIMYNNYGIQMSVPVKADIQTGQSMYEFG